MEVINDDIKLFHFLSNDISNLNINQLNRGIWSLIDIYKNNYPFLLVNYKEYNNINQLFYRFNNNNIFVLNINLWKDVTYVPLRKKVKIG